MFQTNLIFRQRQLWYTTRFMCSPLLWGVWMSHRRLFFNLFTVTRTTPGNMDRLWSTTWSWWINMVSQVWIHTCTFTVIYIYNKQIINFLCYWTHELWNVRYYPNNLLDAKPLKFKSLSCERKFYFCVCRSHRVWWVGHQDWLQSGDRGVEEVRSGEDWSLAWSTWSQFWPSRCCWEHRSWWYYWEQDYHCHHHQGKLWYWQQYIIDTCNLSLLHTPCSSSLRTDSSVMMLLKDTEWSWYRGYQSCWVWKQLFIFCVNMIYFRI